jgi:hypothetical protein
VELNRTFRLVPRTEAEERASAKAREEAAMFHYTQTGELPEDDLTWDDVLKNSLSIVLGEPGSGKTWEFKSRVEALRVKGTMAFFVRLEDLIEGFLPSVIRSVDQSFFSEWERGKKKATFFVDSVDEAKFTRPSDFRRALEHLHDGLGDRGSERLQIVISSRISEWSPQTNEEDVIGLFSSLLRVNQEEEGTSRLPVMQLNPLSRQQVLDFASDKGVPTVVAFGTAIDSANAWVLARRPIDVADLASFWLQNGRLGSLREIVENSVNTNLREDRDEGVTDPLNPERVRQGAETLAAGTLLCRQFNIMIPDPAHTSSAPGLDASGCLPSNWTSAETRALRARPIFDGAVYGRIRFHHRRLAEFLCARWWDRLFDNGLTNLDFEQVFFATSEVGTVLKPSLAPVAAWLAIGGRTRNEKIRELLIHYAPETFLIHGDPEELPIDFKRRVISALLENVRTGKRIWEKTAPEAVGRLADRTLAEFLSNRLLDPASTQDMQEFVLKLILEARLTECGDAVITLLRRPQTAEDTKAYAILALRDCASQNQRQEIAEVIGQQEWVSPFVASRVAEACYPQVLTADGLRALLAKVEGAQDETVNLPYYLRSRLAKVVVPGASRDLLIALLQLTRIEPRVPDDSDREPVSERFRWLRKVIPVVLLKLIEKDSLDESEMQAVFTAFDVVGTSPRQVTDDTQMDKALRTRIKHHVELRSRYFWHRARKLWEKGRVIRATDVYAFDSHFTLRKSDWEWMLRDLCNSEPGRERTVALEGALHLMAVRGGKVGDLIVFLIKAEARSFSAILRSPAWTAMQLGRRWWWNGSKISQFFRPHWWEERWEALVNWTKLQRTRAVLLRHVRDLRQAKKVFWLYGLTSEAHEPDKYGVTKWDRVGEDYGSTISSSARKGFEQSIPLTDIALLERRGFPPIIQVKFWSSDRELMRMMIERWDVFANTQEPVYHRQIEYIRQQAILHASDFIDVTGHLIEEGNSSQPLMTLHTELRKRLGLPEVVLVDNDHGSRSDIGLTVSY